jgi:hypothetical protein
MAVPVLAVASGGCLAARIAFDGDTFAHCDYLGPSPRMYLTAWAGPVLALTALLVLGVTARRMRAGGERLTRHGLGNLAAAAGCLTPVLLLVQCALLYWTYAPDPSGGVGCEGLAALLLPPPTW